MDVINLEHEISKAAFDGSVDDLLRLLEARQRQGVIDWTRQVESLRERVKELTEERARVQSESAHLETVLRDASAEYARSLEVCDKKRVAMQTIQLKLGSLDSRLESLRQEINETGRELKEVVNRKLDKEV